jgi:hypothetical protein
LDAADDPIAKEQVDTMIASDPQLTWSTEDYVDMSDDTRKVTRYFHILWNREPCFWWYQNEIRCAGPDEAQLAKMVEMAAKLDAKVIGDDGEEYH